MLVLKLTRAQPCISRMVAAQSGGSLAAVVAKRRDVGALLHGAPNDSPLRLKEDIARRATSREPDPVVTVAAVLAPLGASRDQVLPAPSLLQTPKTIVSLPQAAEITRRLAASRGPVVVHAAGGVGKSVLASYWPSTPQTTRSSPLASGTPGAPSSSTCYARRCRPTRG